MSRRDVTLSTSPGQSKATAGADNCRPLPINLEQVARKNRTSLLSILMVSLYNASWKCTANISELILKQPRII